MHNPERSSLRSGTCGFGVRQAARLSLLTRKRAGGRYRILHQCRRSQRTSPRRRLGQTRRCYRPLQRWVMELQRAPSWHLLPPRRCEFMAMNRSPLRTPCARPPSPRTCSAAPSCSAQARTRRQLDTTTAQSRATRTRPSARTPWPRCLRRLSQALLPQHRRSQRGIMIAARPETQTKRPARVSTYHQRLRPQQRLRSARNPLSRAF